MNPFTYDQLAARIVFGAGRVAEVGAEVERLGARKVMLIADGQARAPASDITGQLGSRVALSWNEVAQHVPVDLAERARSAATEESIDCVVCVGGGSSTGLAKALALSHAVPIVAVPTTYAGSEQTTIYGLTGGHIFHGELALDQFFTMRPLLDSARYSTPIPNLYLCGSGTHPGAGLTGGSGANAAREILKHLKK